MTRRITLVVSLLLLSSCSTTSQPAPDTGSAAGSWSYSGSSGPPFWAGLQPYYPCSTGREQSPIDLGTPERGAGPKLDLRYQPTQVTVLNNGHYAQIPYDRGSRLWLDGEAYDLEQFHFHAPAEHIGGGLSGEAGVMEVHLVHSTLDNRVAAIALRFVLGAENPFLARFWDQIPPQAGRRPTGIDLDVRTLLPDNLSYFTYPGSLTTPPCGEGVRFFVLQEASMMSRAQLEHFQSIFGKLTARRPLQPLNGRKVIAVEPGG